MPNLELARLRLAAQRIAEPLPTVAQAVRHMGALQAQDYPASLWAVGLRATGATLADIDAAVDRREIARTWPMRGTLHWVPAADLRWMVALMAPRAIAKAAARTRGLEIDAEVLSGARQLLEQAARTRAAITRPETYALFESAGIKAEGQRGIHILQVLAHQGVLCFGPHRGKQPTFVFVDQWLPPRPHVVREDALAELARRYFASHGPATIHDFAWWTGLTLADCRVGLEAAKRDLECLTVESREYWHAASNLPAEAAPVHLLPGFDEYILGYQDRTAVLAPEHAKSIVPGNNGMFMATIVSSEGEVLGTWRKSTSKASVSITPEPFVPLSESAAAGLTTATSRYATFLGLDAGIAG